MWLASKDNIEQYNWKQWIWKLMRIRLRTHLTWRLYSVTVITIICLRYIFNPIPCAAVFCLNILTRFTHLVTFYEWFALLVDWTDIYFLRWIFLPLIILCVRWNGCNIFFTLSYFFSIYFLHYLYYLLVISYN